MGNEKIQSMLQEWAKTKSVSLATDICEELVKEFKSGK